MREEVFDQRLARYYDELKWLYCELYNNDTQAFDYFMTVLGIPHEVLLGKSIGRDGTVGSHAWNRVWIDGGWLYVDCTWDDPVTENGEDRLSYKYFLITEEEISGNHIQEQVVKDYLNRKIKF